MPKSLGDNTQIGMQQQAFRGTGDNSGYFSDISREFNNLKTLDGIEEILFITSAGEVIWSWRNP
ncbi:MAG: hypothetical protein KAU14_09975, partial [Thermoplasmata archaeon]|nr:hypothetical protein [Thermoplasmata archaeon]